MLGVVMFASPLSDVQREYAEKGFEYVKRSLEQYRGLVEVAGLVRSHYDAERVGRELSGRVEALLTIVWSGGTDRMIYNAVKSFGGPSYVYAIPVHNSLASVREAVAALRADGVDVEVLYGMITELGDRIHHIAAAVRASASLKGLRFVQVGNQEPWILITRTPGILRSRLGIELVKVPWEEMLDEAKRADPSRVREVIDSLKRSFGKILVPDEDLEKAVRLYLGMKAIAAKYSAGAMAVEARDMLDPSLRDWGPYLGVALMSDDGIPTDYEGEHDAIITKAIIYHISGKPSFMANLTQVDVRENTAVFSHCTVPTKIIDPKASVLMTYYETNKTVAIRGRMREGETVTFARIGGPALDKMIFGTGVIINGDIGREDLCRTQIQVKVKGRAGDLIARTLGNHMTIAYGDLTGELRAFCKLRGIEPVEIL